MKTFRRAIVALTSLAMLAGLFAVGAVVPAAAAEGEPVASDAPAEAPEVTGEACAPGIGVTVVVDYQQLGEVEIGCAPGEQADGFAALTNAGFTFNDDAGAVAGTICQIRSQPSQGFPSCWYDGFWGYWKSTGAQEWQWSQVGASDGPLPVDSVEGWSWTSPIPEDYSGAPMRLTVEDVADHRAVEEVTEWASIVTGNFRTCAITTGGDAYCWGGDGQGSLGNGATATAQQAIPTPVEAPAGVSWASLATSATQYTTCGVTMTGDGYCWGADTNGLLGNGAASTTAQPSPSAVDAPTGVTWKQMSVGDTHACGVTTTGAGYCWGADGNGRLGNGEALTTAQPSPSPVAAPVGVAWKEISAGRLASCGVTTAGAAYCWGADTNGVLGNGPVSTTAQASPSQVVTPEGVVWASVSVGYAQACALTTAGAAYCWGDDASGVLGNGDAITGAQDAPSAVDAPAGVTWSTVSTRRAQACALTTAGAAYCWGPDANGSLGNGPDITANQASPSAVLSPGEGTWTTIDSAISTCGLRSDDRLWCWGQQNQGALGNGETTQAVVPSPVRVLEPGQTVTFAELPDVTLPMTPKTLSATATSGLPVTLAAAGPCEVSGTTLTASAPGTCTVTASQAGAGRWPAAASVVRSFAIAAPIPAVTITSAPTGIAVRDSAEITYTTDELATTVEYQLDGGDWQPATSPIVVGNLAPGPHTIVVRATGELGGVGMATATWRVRGVRDCAVGPRLPDLGIVDSKEVLPVSMDDGHEVEVAVLADLAADPATATYAVATEVPLAGYLGQTIRIVARGADSACPDAPTFDATYEVRAGYPTVVTSHPGYPGDAVHYEDPRIVAWGNEYEHYFVGPNVGSPPFENPPDGRSGTRGDYGCCTLLGDHGRVDMIFDDAPVTDGEGTDFAVYENGFLVNGTDGEVFIELARIQVSSDGEHWAEFDTASRIPEPIGGYGYAKSNLLGHLAGSHPGPYGTAYDLEHLRNTPEVRTGLVDLSRITRIRVIDVVGDGNDLDSFGRPIYDAWPTFGTGGFDFSGLAVLNQVVVPPSRSRPVADFDGGGTTDRAVFRPESGGWHVEGQDTVYLGLEGDVPVPADFDGDGTTDRAVFRPSTGQWFVEGQEPVSLGLPGDVPVPADYDGDGAAELAVFRDGAWIIDGHEPVFFGLPGDVPVPADYDGDGAAELAVFRDGAWFVEGEEPVFSGLPGDVPVPADYDGDGAADIAVWRDGAWYVEGGPVTYLGLAGDIPVPGDYEGTGTADQAVYRPTGGWYDQATTFFGLPGDIPLVLPYAIQRAQA